MNISELAKSLDILFLHSEISTSNIVDGVECIKVLGKLFKYEIHPNDNMENVTIFVCNKDSRCSFIFSKLIYLGNNPQNLVKEILKQEIG